MGGRGFEGRKCQGREGRGHYRTAFVSVTAEAALALSFMRGAWAGLQPLLAL